PAPCPLLPAPLLLLALPPTLSQRQLLTPAYLYQHYFIPNFFHDSNIKLSLTNLTKLITLLRISEKGYYIFFRKK
ncbi:MAG: hypothetical protein ACKO2Z_06875, partial [Sphaerospermopsis kisseleviana]